MTNREAARVSRRRFRCPARHEGRAEGRQDAGRDAGCAGCSTESMVQLAAREGTEVISSDRERAAELAPLLASGHLILNVESFRLDEAGR
jgi:hypothetical protein